MDELNQNEMPFLESLLIEKNAEITSYHMPGHKGIKSVNPLLNEYYGGDLNRADLVEINSNIDYLHNPKGALLKSEKLAAAAYGADETFFLINGSTVGNMGAIMSVVSPQQKIIISRASHRSVYGGIVLSGGIPIYIQSDYHKDIHFPLAVDIKKIENLLKEHKDIVAIHLTSPNYYGIVSDIESICNLAHNYGIPLIVDEAHGSHFCFHNDLPKSSVYLKADIIIQSTHKSQGSLTQSAMLHFNNNGFVNRSRISQILSLLQSSSPSSILLASLDATRMQMATQGQQYLSKIIILSNKARHTIQNINSLWCYGNELIGQTNIFNFDPTKLIVRVSDAGFTGFQASYILRKQYQIEVEFADLKHIIFSITIADTQLTINKLLNGLIDLIKQKNQINNNDNSSINPPSDLPVSKINLRDAYFANKTRSIPLNQSIGYILAENIIPYPPGVPILVPGEIIQQSHLDYIQHLINKGSTIVGMEDLSIQTVKIIDQLN